MYRYSNRFAVSSVLAIYLLLLCVGFKGVSVKEKKDEQVVANSSKKPSIVTGDLVSKNYATAATKPKPVTTKPNDIKYKKMQIIGNRLPIIEASMIDKAIKGSVPKFFAHDGYEVVFIYQQGAWIAHVTQHLAIGYRIWILPVYLDFGVSMDNLLSSAPEWQERHIYVFTPTTDMQAQSAPYVYVSMIELQEHGLRIDEKEPLSTTTEPGLLIQKQEQVRLSTILPSFSINVSHQLFGNSQANTYPTLHDKTLNEPIKKLMNKSMNSPITPPTNSRINTSMNASINAISINKSMNVRTTPVGMNTPMNETEGYLDEYDLPSSMHIPHLIQLVTGDVVRVTFGSSLRQPGNVIISSDRLVDQRLIPTLAQALNKASETVKIESIHISATTNGHEGKQYAHSNHRKENGARAVDISRINGKSILELGANNPLVIALQNALDETPYIRENFGPYFRHKKRKNYKHNGLHQGHKNHIHFSVNR